MLVLPDFRSDFNHRMQDPLGPAVHQTRLAGRGHVLFQHMHEGIGQPAGDLPLRQRVEGFRIENREDRIIAVKGVLLLGFLTRNDRTRIHLRTRGRHREDGAQRNGFIRLSLEHDIPRIALVEQARSDEFRTVDDRSAAHGQQEVGTVLTAQSHGLADRLDGGIGFDAPEFDPVAPFERLHDLIVNPVAAHAAAAEGNHDLLVGRDQFAESGDLSFAENQFRRIVINEIIHNGMR